MESEVSEKAGLGCVLQEGKKYTTHGGNGTLIVIMMVRATTDYLPWATYYIKDPTKIIPLSLHQDTMFCSEF